jgi:hypothetical protein
MPRLAEQMLPKEVHPDVQTMLDKIVKALAPD